MERSKIKNDLIWNYSSLFFLGLSGIAINLLIGIFYSSSTLGGFNQVLVTYLLTSIFAAGGINFSVLKAISQNHNNPKEILSIIKSALILTFFLSLLITLLYFKLINFFSTLVSSYYVLEGMHRIYPAIFFFAFNKVFLQGIINGLDRMRSYAIYQMIRYFIIFIGLIICIFLSIKAEDLPFIFVFSELFLFIILLSDISINFKWWTAINWIHWVKLHFIFGFK